MNINENQNILITGGLGYIGMELAKLYSGKSRKCNVTVIDNNYYSQRVAQLKRWNIKFKQINILDDENLSKYVKKADIVYHLAGVTDVPTIKDDINTIHEKNIYEVGVTGTRNILNSLPSNSKIVFPSTHVIFEGLKTTEKNIDENRKPIPVLNYSKGKYQSEQDISKSGKNYVILRLGSVYGNSYDSTRFNIMGNIFSKITAENGEISLFSSGEQLKSMVSVFDVARAFMFVGENSEINNEILNCVNEHYTVKQAADICKKINKNLSIKNIDKKVPNNGYSLSNKKIKGMGFNFLYNFKKCVEDFSKSLSDIDKLPDNELIETGRDNFIDNRGIISNFYIDDSINMIGYVESKKNTIRGNHYHPVQTQKCLLIKGKFISVTKDLLDPTSVIETRLINEGDLSTIPPNVAHTMVFLEDSIFLNLVNGEREHKNYGMTHTLKHELVDKDLGKLLINSYKTECRVCGGGLNHYLSLGLSPLANNLNDKKNSSNDLYPLDLNFCKKCSNSQLSVVVPPEKMFDNYLYLSSTSENFKNHFMNFARELKQDLNLNKNSMIVDIGSNDGIFLEPILNLGIKALGIEPAKNVAKIANSRGLNTLSEYFNDKTVKKIKNKHGSIDVVTAFNVFAHSDGLKEILDNVIKLLKKDGEFIFEIQYLFKTIKDLTFDNIYHEHVNYWCLLSILHFFEESEMKVYKVKEVDTHGGSLRVYTTKNKNKRLHKSVNKYIKIEKKNKMDSFETYKKFAIEVENVKQESLDKIKNIISNNKNIVGYGAPAKATTILNYFGLSDNEIEFTLDDNSLKHNKIIPGTNIEIFKPSDLKSQKKLDYIIVLAWNFYDQIKEKMQPVFPDTKFIKLK
jgi:nucleoside-diphosphate-sugar epimerase/2-polyprenyl-3-methyl-5-hydroxy-6-metoxy-1,4-benzoquinol methylase/dTDP-4-dehydrorhamnose 3,5-epimerase-like enzyme